MFKIKQWFPDVTVCGCSLSHKTLYMQQLPGCLKMVILMINEFQSMLNLCNTASRNLFTPKFGKLTLEKKRLADDVKSKKVS